MIPIEATHKSTCGLCDCQIDEADLIVKVDDEWCHAQCAEDEGYGVER